MRRSKLCGLAGRITAALAGVGVLLLNAVTIKAQTAAGPPQTGPEIKAVRVAKPPVIDGEVDESEWPETATASGFMQYEPRRSDLAETRTEVWVSYDTSHLYVAFCAWDSEPLTAQ